MSAKLLKLSRIDPQYLHRKFIEFKKYYSNPPLSKKKKTKKRERTHFIYKLGGCHLFDTTRTSTDYRKIRLQSVGVSIVINAAIFIYFMHHDMKPDALPTSLSESERTEISHLCHNRACVNPQHLHLESNVINKERQKCKDICSGHTPPCYFSAV